MVSEIRTRFAPSPTGYLHIGSARTAIFNWLFSRHGNGKFLLRIEDTDPERSKPEYTRVVLEALNWLGLDFDEDVVYQSRRLEIYREKAEQLVREGKAYYCSCTKEELDRMRELALAKGLKPKYDGRCFGKEHHPPQRPKVIRFRSPAKGITVVDDMIQGKASFDNSELDDLIILRSDGTPTYNFSAVVDDYDMRISHIIRGNDHLNNTPRQIQIYQAFGYTPPVFAHHPLILGEDRSKLSKRHGATSLLEYRDQGYLPSALINFLVRIGWSYGDKEVFSLSELVELFELEKINPAPGVWNPEKLRWLNAQHIRLKKPEEIAELALPFYKKAGLNIELDDYFIGVIKLHQSRVELLSDLPKMTSYFFMDEIEYDENAKKEFLKGEIAPLLRELARKIDGISNFDQKSLEKAFSELLEENGVNMKKLAQPVRVSLTGKKVSPGLFEIMELLGKARVVDRLKKGAQLAERG